MPPVVVSLVMKARQELGLPLPSQHPSQQVPLQQTEVVVSLPAQTVRLGAFGWEQTPVVESQVPAT
jgi:hypothetical protein